VFYELGDIVDMFITEEFVTEDMRKESTDNITYISG
jgi:hypothetical protein